MRHTRGFWRMARALHWGLQPLHASVALTLPLLLSNLLYFVPAHLLVRQISLSAGGQEFPKRQTSKIWLFADLCLNPMWILWYLVSVTFNHQPSVFCCSSGSFGEICGKLHNHNTTKGLKNDWSGASKQRLRRIHVVIPGKPGLKWQGTTPCGNGEMLEERKWVHLKGLWSQKRRNLLSSN